MKHTILLLLALALLALVACSDDDDKKETFNGPIVPIANDWQWAYEVGAEGDMDTLFYTPLPEYEYNGHTDWYNICWTDNQGDNPAIARLDSVGLLYAWPEFRGHATFDRMGRKISDEAILSPSRIPDFYYAVYPVAVGDTWDVYGDGGVIAECVSLDELIETDYISTQSVHYDWTYLTDGEDDEHEHNYFRPGLGLLYTEYEASPDWNYNLTDIIMPENQGRTPLAP